MVAGVWAPRESCCDLLGAGPLGRRPFPKEVAVSDSRPGALTPVLRCHPFNTPGGLGPPVDPGGELVGKRKVPVGRLPCGVWWAAFRGWWHHPPGSRPPLCGFLSYWV